MPRGTHTITKKDNLSITGVVIIFCTYYSSLGALAYETFGHHWPVFQERKMNTFSMVFFPWVTLLHFPLFLQSAVVLHFLCDFQNKWKNRLFPRVAFPKGTLFCIFHLSAIHYLGEMLRHVSVWGHAIAQAVSYQILTTDTCVHSQISPYGICAKVHCPIVQTIWSVTKQHENDGGFHKWSFINLTVTWNLNCLKANKQCICSNLSFMRNPAIHFQLNTSHTL